MQTYAIFEIQELKEGELIKFINSHPRVVRQYFIWKNTDGEVLGYIQTYASTNIVWMINAFRGTKLPLTIEINHKYCEEVRVWGLKGMKGAYVFEHMVMQLMSFGIEPMETNVDLEAAQARAKRAESRKESVSTINSRLILSISDYFENADVLTREEYEEMLEKARLERNKAKGLVIC